MKKRTTKKNICVIQNKDGQELSDQPSVSNRIYEYYETLFSSKKVQTNSLPDELFELPCDKTLTEEDIAMLDNDISEVELFDALNTMEANKTPGSDGLSYEFYKCFWKEIKSELLESYKCSLSVGKMSSSQRLGILTLLPKSDDDSKLKNLDNWRPISLLNTDYKILTKVLTLRLNKVLKKIINSNQTAVAGRYIGFNIRLIKDVMSYYNDKNDKGHILFLDFKKAYDSLEWDFMMKTLNSFKFGKKFSNWIKTLYSEPVASVMNNGYTTKQFQLERGVRQGDSLSGPIFCLCAEIMAEYIRNEKTIKGLSIEGKEIKLIQYADDTTLFLQDEQSGIKCFEFLSEFRKYSGLELNMNKCEGLHIGRNKLSKKILYNISWPSDPVKNLGIYYGHDETETNKFNYDQKIKNLKKSINIWRSRNLSLLGRITVVKTYVLSKLIYVMNNLGISEGRRKEVNKLIQEFIWNYKPPRMRKDIAINAKHDGGLSLPDINIIYKSLMIKWAKRYLQQENELWETYVDNVFRKHGGKLLFYSNITFGKLHDRISDSFYSDMISSWESISSTSHQSIGAKNQIVWNNRHITISGKTLYLKHYCSAGIKYISDLRDTDDKFLSWEVFKERYKVKTNFIEYISLLKVVKKFELANQNNDVNKNDCTFMSSLDLTKINNLFIKNAILSSI